MSIDIPSGIERRQTPRYRATLELDMVLENDNIVAVKTRNISSHGVQITCGNWITDQIEPRGIQSHSVGQILIKTIIELPVTDNTTESHADKNKTSTKKLYANCRIISVQRISQGEYMLSLAFIDFENDSEKALDEYLNQYTQKKIILNSIA
jgi:hypothetical protein